MNRITLTTRQLSDALEKLEGVRVTDDRLCRWGQTGLLLASIRHPTIRGRNLGRLWSLKDVARARIVVRLRRDGIPLQRVRTVMAFIERELPQVLKPGTTAVLIVTGARAVIVKQPNEPDLELPAGQYRLKLDEVMKGNAETAAAMTAAA